MTSEQTELPAPGWDAIDHALTQLHGSQEPKHYGTIVKYSMGGPDPLDGISVYSVDEPIPHWHYITYGLTELYAKESPRIDESGFGFELTFRLRRDEEESGPPVFVVNLLQNLARYVFETGRPFDPGHTKDAQGPIRLGAATKMTALCFAKDPDLPPLDTPHGRMTFVQSVGITHDELMAAKAWRTDSFLEVLGRTITNKWITDLERSSILQDTTIAAEVQKRTEMEGSSTAAVFMSQTTVRRKGLVRSRFQWILGALDVPTLVKILPGRVPFGETFTVWSQEAKVVFRPSAANRVVMSEDHLEITLNTQGVAALTTGLKPKGGRYQIDEIPNLTLKVIASEVRDGKGNVVEIVG